MTVFPKPEGSPYLSKLAELITVDCLSQTLRLFQFRLRDGSRLDYKPGQFVEVSVFGVGEAPISISSSPTRDDSFELGVREVGNVTQALHRLAPGSLVGIRGPFGNGFPVAEVAGHDLLLVAGGTGICPIRSMVQYALDKRSQFGRVILLYGCREPGEQLFHDELKEWRRRHDIELTESVNRCPHGIAWEGKVGIITSFLAELAIDPSRTTAIVVGPPVMYRYVVNECLRKGIAKSQIMLSLERRMKCGMGFCGHCQTGNAYVCLDGPVFSYERLSKLREVEI